MHWLSGVVVSLLALGVFWAHCKTDKVGMCSVVVRVVFFSYWHQLPGGVWLWREVTQKSRL